MTQNDCQVVAVRFVRRFPFFHREEERTVLYDHMTPAEAEEVCELLTRQEVRPDGVTFWIVQPLQPEEE